MKLVSTTLPSSPTALALANSSYSYSSKIVAKKSKTPQTASTKGSEPPPPRITSNVKQNLQFLKLWKEFQKRKSNTPKPSTSYRRKRVEKDEMQEDMDLYRDPTLTLYYTHQGIETAIPVLLVDGYNVCGYWAKLKKHFMNGRLDIARQKLIDELVTFSMLREVKVVVVFDAMMSGLPTHKENFEGIDIVYSAETCADAWIEKEVVALREDGCPKVWVVTSDHCQQHAAYGAGAFVWSSKALVSEIKASQKEVEQMLREHRLLVMSLGSGSLIREPAALILEKCDMGGSSFFSADFPLVIAVNNSTSLSNLSISPIVSVGVTFPHATSRCFSLSFPHDSPFGSIL